MIRNYPKNHKILKQIKTFQELLKVLENDISIYWNFKVMPTAFFLQWSIAQLKQSIKCGCFYKVKKLNKEK